MQKFNTKCRIASARLQDWNYGSNAAYFITICTKGRIHYFGAVLDGKMQLSPTGELAHQFWDKIPDHFPFVALGESVIMPNHMHGIIIIDKHGGGDDGGNIADVCDDNGFDDGFADGLVVEAPESGVSTTSSQTAAASRKWKPDPGVIINQYKRMVTIHARKTNTDFAWHSRFYDHIVRNNADHHRISHYIVNNPMKW